MQVALEVQLDLEEARHIKIQFTVELKKNFSLIFVANLIKILKKKLTTYG